MIARLEANRTRRKRKPIDKRERIQKEKQREHVQVVLDFSSIRETLAKGGVVATTLTCPQCSGATSHSRGWQTDNLQILRSIDKTSRPVR
jgi:hypothetical protein